MRDDRARVDHQFGNVASFGKLPMIRDESV